MEDYILKYIKSKNRKRIIKGIFLSIFLIIGFAITSLFMGGGNTTSNIEANTFKTTVKRLPINSNPDNETDLDNLAYLAYNIQANKNFKSESIGEARASVMGIPYIQKIHDSRIVNSDYMFQQTISTSTFVSFGLQKFYFDDKIIRRNEESINGDTVEWKNEPTDAITYKLADEIYGWTPDQISAYILCSDTILSTERISNGENGYYEIKYSLNPKNAPYKYQNQVKEFGESDGYPSFNSIELTFKFNSNWVLESIHTEENYIISMMNMNLNIKTNINENFTYSEANSIKDANFFIKYKNMEAKGEKEDKKLDAQGLLLQGFSDLLNGENVSYKAILNINNKDYDILLKLSLNDKHFIVNIMNELYLDIQIGNSLIFINYHNLHLKYTINEEYINNLINFIKSYFNIEDNNIDISNLDFDLIAKNLLKSEVIIDEENNTASISSSLKLANFEIPLSFTFINNNNSYELKNINTNITINDNIITADIEKTNQDIKFDSSYDYQSINDIEYILNNIIDLMNSNGINLNINLNIPINDDIISINGNIDYLIKFNSLRATINLLYNSNNYLLDIYYSNEIITIKYSNLIVEFNINEAKNILSSISLPDFDLKDIIIKLSNYLSLINFNKTIDSLIINNSKLELTLYLNNSNSYKCSINNIDNGLNINISNIANINITKSNLTSFSIPNGLDLTSLLNIISFISDNKDSSFKLQASLLGNIYGYDFSLIGDLFINNDFSLLFNGKIAILNQNINFKLIYKDNSLYLTIFNKTISLTIDELKNLLPNDTSFDINSLINILSNIDIDVINNKSNLLINASLAYKNINLNTMSFILEANDYNNIEIGSIDYNINDINNLNDIINNIIELTNSNSLEINLESSINVINLSINGLIELNNNKFDLNIKIDSLNLEFNIKYIDNYFYLSYKNIRLKLTLNEIITIINRYITIDNNIDYSNIINIISNIDLSINQNALELTINLSENKNINLIINTSNGLNLTISDLNINNITIANTNASIKKSTKIIPEITLEYLEYSDLDGLLRIVDNLVNIIKNKNIGIDLSFDLLISNVKINTIIAGSIDLDSNEARLNLELNILNTTHIINLIISNNEIKLSYGNIAIRLNINQIPDLIKYIGNIINLDDININIKDITINDIIDNLIINISKDNLNLGLNLNDLILNIIIFNNNDSLDIIVNDINIDKINISNIKVNISNAKYDYDFSNDNYLEYDDLINIIDNIEDIINLTKKKSFNLSFYTEIMNNDYVRFEVNAKAYILVNDDGSFDLDVSLDLISMTKNDNDYTIDFVIKNNYCYLDIKLARRDDKNHDFLRVSSNINDILSIVSTISKFIGIDIPLLDKFIDSDISLDKNSLGFLIPSKDEIINICFSDYLKSISSNNNYLSIIIDGNKLFKANDDLEIILGKANGSSDINYLNIKNIYTNNSDELVEKFNIDLKLLDEDFVISDRDSSQYIDISSINELLKAFVNTASLNDFHIKGSFVVDANVGISIKMTINFEAIIKLDENKIPTIIVKFYDIPVIVGVNNDVPYSTGDFNGGDNRDLALYFKGKNVYMYRSEDISRFAAKSQKYEKKLYTTLDLFLGDIYYYLLQVGFGFSDSIVSSIKDGMNVDENHVIDLAKIIDNYSKDKDNNYSLSISLGELTGNNQLGNMIVNISTENIDGKNYISSLGLNIDINVSILTLKLSTNDTELVNIKESVDISELEDYINNYQYKIDELWTARSSNWKLISSIEYSMIFDCNNGNIIEDKYKYNDLINYPIFDEYVLINGKYMIFSGWYTDSEFSDDSLYDVINMPRNDINLYAKWGNARTGLISFETSYGESPNDIYQIEGSNLLLPDMPLIIIDNTYYSFLYWSYNGEIFDYDLMPNGEYNLLAIWEEVTPYLYYNDQLITLRDIDERIAIINSNKGCIYNSITLNDFISKYSKLSFDNNINLYVFESKVYSFEYFINNINGYYYIEYNIDSKYNSNNNYIGTIYSNDLSASILDIPYYSYNNYEVNAWFSSSSLASNNLITDLLDIKKNTILYPYYSTKASYFKSEDNKIIGINDNNLETIIIPIIINNNIITTIADEAFLSYSSLKNLVISCKIAKLGTDSFKACNNLVNLYMGDNVLECSRDSFYMSNKNNASKINYYSNTNNIDIATLIAYKGSFSKTYYYSSFDNFKNPIKYDIATVINQYALN